MSDTTLVWGEIDGQTITFPMEVAAMHTATMVFSVPSDPAPRLLPRHDYHPPPPAGLPATSRTGNPPSHGKRYIPTRIVGGGATSGPTGNTKRLMTTSPARQCQPAKTAAPA